MNRESLREGNYPEYPFIASVLEFKPRKLDAEFLCAAAVVSRKHLITAAHCFDERPVYDTDFVYSIHCRNMMIFVLLNYNDLILIILNQFNEYTYIHIYRFN